MSWIEYIYKLKNWLGQFISLTNREKMVGHIPVSPQGSAPIMHHISHRCALTSLHTNKNEEFFNDNSKTQALHTIIICYDYIHSYLLELIIDIIFYYATV